MRSPGNTSRKLAVSVLEITRSGGDVAVAVNVAVSTAPPITAETLFVPGVAPSVQRPRVATPFASVVRVSVAPPVPPEGGAMLPPPAVTWNITVAYAIGCGGISMVGLPRSITTTDGGATTAAPAAAV